MTAPTDSDAIVRPGAHSAFVTHLECSKTGEHYPKDTLLGLSQAGAPLLVRYDLDALAGAVSKDTIASRSPDMWRYREFLPLGEDVEPVSLGEPMTPLVRLPTVEARLGAAEILVKDEGRLPTGSFKGRGMSVAVSMAKALGVTRIAIPTAGNAGAGLAAYASRAGIESFVFTPADTPEVTASEIAFHGARAWRVDGLVGDCAKIVSEGADAMDWYDFTTLKEPYRVEGKRTMGLELAEQYEWELPDIIFFPTGGGVCLIAMWKVFKELEEMGWLKGPLPRMVAVQSTGCGPIVQAFDAGLRDVEPWGDVTTNVHGVRVPNPIGGSMVLDVLYESDGFGTLVDDDAVHAARAKICAEEGFHMCPEGAACVVALEMERAAGRVGPKDRIVLFNSASGLKSPMPPMTNFLEPGKAVDYSAL
ncbi:MAG: threonine synthase [Alphaproteobacteria bacterium]|nr:threonine synthase [Alphaproteobacteria bacterium]